MTHTPLRYLRAALAALTVMSASFCAAIVPAGASTTQCAQGPLGAYCGTLASAAGDSVDAYRAAAAVDNPVIGWHNNPGDAGSDFAILTSPRTGGAKELLYTPGGQVTGLCASDPGGGYPQDPSYPDGIVLRLCNGSKFQSWTYAGQISGTGGTPTVLTNMATGLVLTDNGFDHQLTDAAPLPAGSDNSQLWTIAS